LITATAEQLALALTPGPDQLEITFPRGLADKQLVARFWPSGVAAVQMAGAETSISMRWALSRIHYTLRVLRDDRVTAIFGQIAEVFVSLSNWPAARIKVGDLLPPRVRSHTEYPFTSTRLGKRYRIVRPTDVLGIVGDFAGIVLDRAGFLDYEEPLAQVTSNYAEFAAHLEGEGEPFPQP